MLIQLLQLLRIQPGFTPDIIQVQQGGDPTFSEALAMAAHGVWIDQQGLGEILHPPTRPEQDHRMEAIGLTRIAHPPVGRTQFAEFLGVSG